MPEGCYPVSHSGPEDANIMICGESLGADEVIHQEPFVGMCGQLLSRMLKLAEINRSKCFITNVLHCNPREGSKNRPPTQEEIQLCKHWLWEQIKIVNPKIIVTAGAVSTKLLLRLKPTVKFGDYVGKIHKVNYISSLIIPIYHPSFLLQRRKDLIEDTIKVLKSVKELLE